jgi:hypothetical protein
MLDIEEFQKARSRVLENRYTLDDLSTLESYIDDLELVCTNERSFKLAEILSDLIAKTESLVSPEILFKLLTLYAQQIYQYLQNLDESIKIIEKMELIAEQTQNPEHIAYTHFSKSIVNRIMGFIDDSNKSIHQSLDIMITEKKNYPDTYHTILFSYSVFSMVKEENLPEITRNIETCVDYWYSNQNTLSMVIGIHLLLRCYSLLGNEDKFNELIDWIFSEEKIQDRILDSHFTILYSYVGTIYGLNSKIPEAIKYLQEAYDRVKQTGSQEELMYEFVEIQKLLCRSYAFIGKYEESYEILINFLSYLESDFVAKNYIRYKIKTQYFSAYYTLLFIYVQLDVNISSIEDERLLRIHNYTKELIEQSEISRDLLFETTLDEQEKIRMSEEKSIRPDELHMNLYQQLISLETYSANEKTIDNINIIRNYIFNPLYADIIIGKIHFSKSDFKNFNTIVEKLNAQVNKADTPFLQLWIKLFNLLNHFLDDPKDSEIITEVQNLEDYCRASKFFKMADEVNFYWKLLKSSLTLEAQSSRFQQTAFLDIYNKQSRKMALEILDQKDS